MPTGVCKLCLQTKDLQDSHLMPAAAYKKTRGTGKGSRHPVTLTAKASFQNSRQISDFVLCKDCEQRFNAGGEAYVMRLVTSKKRFPLLEKLRASKPTHRAEILETDGYSASDSGDVNRAKLAYFAASVFWRASAHTWRGEDGLPLSIRLGSMYQEEFRQFLLGKQEFPRKAALAVFACSDRLSQETFFMPSTRRTDDYLVHGFVCRGILFALVVGRSIPVQFRKLSMVGTTEQWILVSDCIKHRMWWLER
jgi:hypothetical protein